MSDTPIRVLIVDDHPVVRDGLRRVLEAEADIEVVGEAGDAQHALFETRAQKPDLILMDVVMPGKSGMELIKQVRAEKPRLRILVLSMHEEQQYAVRAIKAGAAGYLTKESASSQLVSAIRKIAAGGAFISTAVAEQLALGAMPQADGPLHNALSDREFQVFRLLAEGKSVSDIAGQLTLSVKTISTHKARLMQKMNLGSTTDLIRYAISNRLIDAEDGTPG